MRWKKLGKIFDTDNVGIKWMHSHAMMPVVEKINEEEIKVYFSPRDKENRSRPASFIYNLKSKEIKELSKTPLLELGEIGCYDDAGVMPTSIVNFNENKYMYYNGWTLGKKIPFFSFNGIAIKRKEEECFVKLGRYPVALNRDEIDPYSTFAPFVIKEQDKWRMWYVSLIKWQELSNGELKHFYHIKYAESKDGINWEKNGHICIDFKNEYEYAIARPCVIKHKGIYKMWYSYRASEKNITYRIGYAESKDGLNWERKDKEMGDFIPSSYGWDSEMICYGYVFEYKNQLYMLYNGNSYGKTGIGLAVLEEDESDER